MDNDFLITGAGRSGTTLMWRLLAAHSMLSVRFEPLSGPCGDAKAGATLNGSKQPLQYANHTDWMQRYKRMRFINLERLEPKKVICMRRDIQDIVYSFMTRNGWPMTEIKLTEARKWTEYGYEYLDEYCQTNNVPLLNVQFEELCQKTATVLKGICKFLEVPYEKDMTKKWKDKKVDGRWIGHYNTATISLPVHKEKERKEFDELYAKVFGG